MILECLTHESQCDVTEVDEGEERPARLTGPLTIVGEGPGAQQEPEENDLMYWPV